MLIDFYWETGTGLGSLFLGFEFVVLFWQAAGLRKIWLGRTVIALNSEICLLQQL